ncbi:uncharacterized protein LOC135118726 [Helicoverpa armigera]|uniref:uncharacterized protein LOC135118726 n=1 Tax=Helicoverpa armigera TaxID=29058 RepID=UPI003083924B
MDKNSNQTENDSAIIMDSNINDREQEMSDSEGEYHREEIIVQAEIEENTLRPEKRDRSDEEEEWNLVNRKEKKLKMQKEKIEIYLSSQERMPKQFALAKLFKMSGIVDIDRVKYINPFKVRIEVDNEFSANKIEKCQAFIDRNWNIQRAMERSSSYGVIRDVDLDLSDEDILKCISCKKPAEIISVYRLKRRDPEGIGWQPSEAVQVCFKGSFIPQYVYVEGLRIKVTPYLFPVSQCSKCWKYGHLYKKCPSSKVVCPKCGGPHENCETETFRCVNCSGKHMALAKNSCPVFLKEKKISEIMNEFNCTHRKALSVYVPPSPVNVDNSSAEIQPHPSISLRFRHRGKVGKGDFGQSVPLHPDTEAFVMLSPGRGALQDDSDSCIVL